MKKASSTTGKNTKLNECNNRSRRTTGKDTTIRNNNMSPNLRSIDSEMQNGGDDSHDCLSERDFFADSPYHDVFVEKEMYSLDVLTTILNDFREKISIFSEAGAFMADSTRNLSLSFQLLSVGDNSQEGIELKRKAIGSEMAGVLGRLGKTLNEMAEAQDKLSSLVEGAIDQELIDIAVDDMNAATALKQEATIHAEKAEKMVSNYLNGNEADENLKNVVGMMKNMEHKGGSNKRGKNLRSKVKRSLSVTSLKGMAKSFGGSGEDPGSEELVEDLEANSDSYKTVQVANWNYQLHRMQFEETTAEIYRFKLSQHIIDSKHNRSCELNDGVSKLFKYMKSYYHTCSGMMEGMNRSLNENTEICQLMKDGHSTKGKLFWGTRERSLVETHKVFKKSALESKKELQNMIRNYDYITDPASSFGVDVQKWTIEDSEREIQIWDLPTKLADCTDYSRVCPEGVLVESWLYQQDSETLEWNKGWFLLKNNDAMYCLQSDPATKHKLCDLHDCQVEELDDKDESSSIRFRFQLTIPDLETPIIFQSRGRKEFEFWSMGILAAINKSSKMSRSRKLDDKYDQSNEIISTIVDRDDFVFNGCHDENDQNEEQFSDQKSYYSGFSKVTAASTSTTSANSKTSAESETSKKRSSKKRNGPKGSSRESSRESSHRRSSLSRESSGMKPSRSLVPGSKDAQSVASKDCSKSNKDKDGRRRNISKANSDKQLTQNSDRQVMRSKSIGVYSKETSKKSVSKRRHTSRTKSDNQLPVFSKEIEPNELSKKESKTKKKKPKDLTTFFTATISADEKISNIAPAPLQKLVRSTSAGSDSIGGSVCSSVCHPLVEKIMQENPVCADCGKQSPDWGLLQYGCLICLECCGAHRLLGVEQSKIRWLTLDKLSDSEALLLQSLGNDRVNKIWQKSMLSGNKKHFKKELSDQKEREKWIKRKYKNKEFINASGNGDNGKKSSREKKERICGELISAAKRSDIFALAYAVAHGADLNWRNQNEDNKTAIQVSRSQFNVGSDKNAAIACTEFLIQNGAIK